MIQHRKSTALAYVMGKKGKRKNALASGKQATSRRDALAAAQARSLGVPEEGGQRRALASRAGCVVKGINNSGNTCYFNSVVQALHALQPSTLGEVEYCGGKDVTTQLAEVLSNLSGASSKSSINAVMLLNALARKFSQFKGRRQQDAHELFVGLLSAVDDEGNPDPAAPHQTTFADTFTSKLVSVVKCSGCGCVSCCVEEHRAISLQLPGSQQLSNPPRPGKTMDRKRVSRANADSTAVASYGFEALASSSSASSAATSAADQDSDRSSEAGTELDQIDETEKKRNVEEELEAQTSAPSIAVIEPPEPPIVKDFSMGGSTVGATLAACLDHFTSTEDLSPSTGNGFACSNNIHRREGHESGELQAATRRFLFVDPAADALVFHLKRLLPGGKLSTHISFPERIDMTPYTGCTTDDGATPSGLHPERANSSMYALAAVVVHTGSQYGGHYITFARHAVSGDGESDQTYKWYYTSDSAVRVASRAEVLGCQAYMLFYTRESETADADATTVVDTDGDQELVDEYGQGGSPYMLTKESGLNQKDNDDDICSEVQHVPVECEIDLTAFDEKLAKTSLLDHINVNAAGENGDIV